MGIRIIEIIATIALNFVYSSYTEHILPCSVSQLHPCPGDNQICDGTTLQCTCIEGFVRVGDDCSPENSSTGSNHDATAVVVSIFTIALVVAGLVLVIRKYSLVEYIRQKINLRRNNDVMYEDVMIGQDDPPLVP